MENYSTERQEVNPTYHHHVKEIETEESLSHYILSTTGNGTFTERMKDEDLNSCVPIESCGSKTGALRQDIKRRPDIRMSQYQDKESNYSQGQHLQEDSRIESAHNIPYPTRGSQYPQYDLPKHLTDKEPFEIVQQRQMEDHKNNNSPYKEPITSQEVQTYSDLRKESKLPRESEEIVAPSNSFSNQHYHRVTANDDYTSREGDLHDVPFQDKVSVIDESGNQFDDLKIRNEILQQNKTFPNIIQIHENEKVYSSSCSIDEGYASTEMIQSVHNTKPKQGLRTSTSTITNHHQLTDVIEVNESSTSGQTIMRSRNAQNEVDAFDDVNTARNFEGKDVHFTSSTCSQMKAGLTERLQYSKSPIGTAFRNELRQDADVQARNKSGYSPKNSNLVYNMQYRRVSPSPLILITNYNEEKNGFALQDPPRKIKRQLSNEFERSRSFVPATEEIEKPLTPIREPGTPKRLKSSTYQNLPQNQNISPSSSHHQNLPLTSNIPSSQHYQNHRRTVNLSQSPHYQNQQQTVNVPQSPHYQNHQQTVNVPQSPHYQNHQQTVNGPQSPHYQNHQQTVNVPQSPHIRTSSVIKTPTPKRADRNIFVFPDTADNSNTHDYRFNVSSHNSNERSIKSHEEFLCNGRAIMISPFQAPYRSSPVTPQKEFDFIARHPTDHELDFNQQISPEKRVTLRSQSNIEDKSPYKYSTAELNKIRYLRSVSLPTNKHDPNFINRSMDRQEPVHTFREDGARRELFRENSHLHSTLRDTWNNNHMQSINELDVPRRMGNITGHSTGMWDGQYLDQYMEQIQHHHTYDCCSNLSRRRPLTTMSRCQGDIDMTIQCSGIGRECQGISQQLKFLNHTQHHDRWCDCKRIEDDVLKLALDAYGKIPKECYTLSEQFQRDKELEETNYIVLEAIKVALRMRELCGNGRSVSRIYNGSVVIRLNCPTLNSLEDLWLKYKSGELQTLTNNIFITPSILLKNRAKFINLSVTISDDEYRVCQAELMASFLRSTSISPSINVSPFKMSPDKRAAKSAEDLLRMPDSPKATMTKTRCSSTPILLCHSPGSPMEIYSPNTSSKRERKFSFGDQSRRAFQDLNSPRSPNLFNLEDLRQIVESPLFDQDEDDQENMGNSFQSRGSNSRHGSPYSPLVSPKSPNCSPLSPRYSPR